MKKILILTTTILLLLLITACSKQEQTSQIPQGQGTDSLTIEIQGIEGQSAMEILKNRHQIEIVETVSGSFVRKIDSFENSTSAFWLYSVNDSLLPVAADLYITSDSDLVKWHFRKASE